MGIGLATTAQAAERIKHAGTHETHERDHTQLESRRRIPGGAPAPYPPRPVHPSWRNLNIIQRLIDDLSRLSRLSRHGARVGRRIIVRRSISHDRAGSETWGSRWRDRWIRDGKNCQTEAAWARTGLLRADDRFINDSRAYQQIIQLGQFEIGVTGASPAG
jgi:hypothetical protein